MTQFKVSTRNVRLEEFVVVIDFVVLMVETWKRLTRNGRKISILDIGEVFPIVRAGIRAFTALKRAPGVWKEATEEERREVYEYFRRNFSLEESVVENKIEKAALVGILLYEILEGKREGGERE